jgi:hypothetical protein
MTYQKEKEKSEWCLGRAKDDRHLVNGTGRGVGACVRRKRRRRK